MASMVTSAPRIARRSSSSGMAVISLDLAAQACRPSTRRCRLAQADTRCSGLRSRARSWVRREVLPSMALTMSFSVSWLGMPRAKGRKRRGKSRCRRPRRRKACRRGPPAAPPPADRPPSRAAADRAARRSGRGRKRREGCHDRLRTCEGATESQRPVTGDSRKSVKTGFQAIAPLPARAPLSPSCRGVQAVVCCAAAA